MSSIRQGGMTEAVFLFDLATIFREMLLPEFDALLDGFARIDRFSGMRVNAAYVLIDSHLSVRSLVCFQIGFTATGVPSSQWNLPLRQMADRARSCQMPCGDVMRVASYSRCEDRTFADHLWDPTERHLHAIKASVARNRLGIVASNDASRDMGERPSSEANTADAHYMARITELLRDHKRALAALEKQHDEALARVREEERAKTRHWHQTALRLNRELLALRGSIAQVSEHGELRNAAETAAGAPSRASVSSVARPEVPQTEVPHTECAPGRRDSRFGG